MVKLLTYNKNRTVAEIRHIFTKSNGSLGEAGCVGWMFLLNGLPWLHHPTLKSPRFARATNDRFFLVIEARDPKFVRRHTETFLETLDPLSIEALEA